LDLDETIIFQIKDAMQPATFEVPTDNGEVVPCLDTELRFSARPNWQTFLEEISAVYEIVIFTASTQYYATLVMQTLDPQKKYFNGLLSRNHCLMTKNGFFIKDLRMVDNRDLKDVLLLDNYVHSFAFNLDNGIPILEWRGEMDDDELLHMIPYLKELAREVDVREANKKQLALWQIPKLTIIS
jgi:CTD small phosphatase-like protein 2